MMFKSMWCQPEFTMTHVYPTHVDPCVANRPQQLTGVGIHSQLEVGGNPPIHAGEHPVFKETPMKVDPGGSWPASSW